MVENQQDKNLQSFRQQIDKIDSQIINLLEERMRVVSQVTSFKKGNNEKFFIKSAREVDMIKGLVAQAGENIPPALVANLWRKIITASNMHEQPIRVIINNPRDISDYKYLVKAYYSESVPIVELNNTDELIAEFKKNSAQIAVFDVSEKTWWIDLASNEVGLNIFAKTPLIKSDDQIELFLAAVKDPEKSSSDSSLLVIEIADNFSERDLIESLESCGFEAKILQTAENTHYLVEIAGFYLKKDQLIAALQQSRIKPTVKILGHYANQINA
jgi:chorismate mutase